MSPYNNGDSNGSSESDGDSDVSNNSCNEDSDDSESDDQQENDQEITVNIALQIKENDSNDRQEYNSENKDYDTKRKGMGNNNWSNARGSSNSNQRGNFNQNKRQNYSNNKYGKKNDSNWKNNNDSCKKNNQGKNDNQGKNNTKGNNSNQGNNNQGNNNQGKNKGNKNNKGNNNNYNNNNNNNQGKNKNNGNQGNKNNNKKQKKDDLMELWDKLKPFIFRNESFQPLNSWMLHLHYRVAVLVFMFYWYIVIKYNWFGKSEIDCIDSFNAIDRVEKFIENICLSYSFIEVTDVYGHHARKYIVTYRWLPHIFVILCIVFYIPRILMKISVHNRFKRFATDLQSNSSRISTSDSDNLKDEAVRYFERNFGTHRELYFLFVFYHLISVFISCGSFLFLDFAMQGDFWTLPLTYPFTRDPRKFRDKLSEVFPPFTTCVIGPSTQMQNGRESKFHCHLIFHELYEKILIFLWIFLMFVICVGSAFVLLISLISLPPFRRIIFGTHFNTPKLKKAKKVIFDTFDIGDIFCLYLIKGIISEVQFGRILEGIEAVIEKHGNLLSRGAQSIQLSVNNSYASVNKQCQSDNSLAAVVVSKEEPVAITGNEQANDGKSCSQRTINVSGLFNV